MSNTLTRDQQQVVKTIDAAARLHGIATYSELAIALRNCAEALAHCMGNEFAPVVEARAALAKSTT